MPPKKGSSKASKPAPTAEDQPEIRQKPEKLADVFKRGNALRKLRSAARDASEDFSEDTLLLEDGSCDITLGSLMESEGLSKKEAIKVMLQFRLDSGGEEKKPASNKGWTLPPASKPAKKSKEPEAKDCYEAKALSLMPSKTKDGKKTSEVEDPPEEDSNNSNKAATETKATAKMKRKELSVHMDEANQGRNSSEAPDKKKKKMAEETLDDPDSSTTKNPEVVEEAENPETKNQKKPEAVEEAKIPKTRMKKKTCVVEEAKDPKTSKKKKTEAVEEAKDPKTSKKKKTEAVEEAKNPKTNKKKKGTEEVEEVEGEVIETVAAPPAKKSKRKANHEVEDHECTGDDMQDDHAKDPPAEPKSKGAKEAQSREQEVEEMVEEMLALMDAKVPPAEAKGAKKAKSKDHVEEEHERMGDDMQDDHAKEPPIEPKIKGAKKAKSKDQGADPSQPAPASVKASESKPGNLALKNRPKRGESRWSCASLEMGQEQLLSEKQSRGWTSETDSVSGGQSQISEILESLGASASQVTSSGDYSAVLQMVNKLQEQLKLVQSEVAKKPEPPQPAEEPTEDVADDDDGAWEEWDEQEVEAPEPKKRPSLSPSEEEACGAAYWAGDDEEHHEQEGDEKEEEEGDEQEGEEDDEQEEEEGDEKEGEDDEKEQEEGHDMDQKEGMDEEMEQATEGEDRQLENHEKKVEPSTRAVATPARAAAALQNLHRLASTSSLKAPSTEATQPDTVAAPPAAVVVNSTTHKKEYMACESSIRMSKKSVLEGKRSMELVAVKDMPLPPYRFSKPKIDAIVSRGGGVPDRDAPHVLEETKFWVTTCEQKVDSSAVSYEEEMTVHTRATAATASRIMDGVVEPGLHAKRTPPSASPLSSDVLRAYDSYNTKLSEAVGTAGQSAAGDLLR
ncbi:unnamed protein product [Symbiodinium sp. CCMP2456]|nr:unnamed protein product [Symbiodinium sp. CCMP2456]